MLPSDNYRFYLGEQAKGLIDQKKWVEVLDALSMLMLLDGTNMNVAMSNLKSLKMQQETSTPVQETSILVQETSTPVQETLPIFDTLNEVAACIENTQEENCNLSNITNLEIDNFFKRELTLEKQHSSVVWDLFMKQFEDKMNAHDKFQKSVEPGSTLRPKIYQRFRDRYTELKGKKVTASNARNQYSLTESYYQKMNKSDSKQIQVSLS